ncbi:MAG: hypothetical protein IJL98_00840 [Lachnospiraceae bacterium]|nr:hypothetical protein [Lachnospiraceae bacterium]
MKNRKPTIYQTALILTVLGFTISLLAKCFYWSIRWETGNLNRPNWMRIRFLLFYLMPLALMILHFLVDQKHRTQGFYLFSCVLLFGQAVVRITEYLSMRETPVFLVLEGVIAMGFLVCTAENLQPSGKRWIPRLVLFFVMLLHLGLIIRDTAILTGIASENLTLVKALYFLAESALAFFDAAALLWLYAVSGAADGRAAETASGAGEGKVTEAAAGAGEENAAEAAAGAGEKRETEAAAGAGDGKAAEAVSEAGEGKEMQDPAGTEARQEEDRYE